MQVNRTEPLPQLNRRILSSAAGLASAPSSGSGAFGRGVRLPLPHSARSAGPAIDDRTASGARAGRFRSRHRRALSSVGTVAGEGSVGREGEGLPDGLR
jgi:hypothetical protein